MGQGSESLISQHEGLDADDYNDIRNAHCHNNSGTYNKIQYDRNKKAKTGSIITCPICQKQFVKKSYQQAFCSNKRKGNCKDKYWNVASDKRRARTRMYR